MSHSVAGQRPTKSARQLRVAPFILVVALGAHPEPDTATPAMDAASMYALDTPARRSNREIRTVPPSLPPKQQKSTEEDELCSLPVS